MPSTPRRPCRHIGCVELTADGWCIRHKAERVARYDREQRPERGAFYSLAPWKRLRLVKLNRNPVCEDCGKVLALQVHHVMPIETHPNLSLTMTNLRSLCASCHSRLEAKAGNFQRRKNS